MENHLEVVKRIFPNLNEQEINECCRGLETLEDKQKACLELATKKAVNEISESPPSTEQPSSEELETIEQIIQQDLKQEAGSSYPESLETLKTLLGNLQKDPNEPKYKRIRASNPKFHRALGRFTSGLLLLEILGFYEESEDVNGNLEKVLYCQSVNSQTLQKALSLLPQNKPQPKESRSQMLARVTEKRLRNPVTYPPPNNKPTLTNQLQEYRLQKKQVYQTKRPKFMTLADLDKAEAPQPSYHSPASQEIRNIAYRAFELSNNFRASQGLRPLVWNEGLSEIGIGHSRDMAEGKVPFGHEGFEKRFRSFPIRGCRGGAENVAMSSGLSDPSKVAVDGWIQSPGHRKNLVGNFVYMGIGVYRNSRGQWYFTQLFALA